MKEEKQKAYYIKNKEEYVYISTYVKIPDFTVCGYYIEAGYISETRPPSSTFTVKDYKQSNLPVDINYLLLEIRELQQRMSKAEELGINNLLKGF